MIGSRVIKRRIRSAKNIAQITKAMQMVAAAKMKKAQAEALAGRPYATKIQEAVSEFASTLGSVTHPLFQTFPRATKTLVLLVSTNKGLCGGLNTNQFRSVITWFKGNDVTYITIGKKGRNFVLRSKASLLADFSDHDVREAIAPVVSLIVEEYVKGIYKDVWIVYNEFLSALSYEPMQVHILPFSAPVASSQNQGKARQFVVEPSLEQVVASLLPHYLETQVRRSILEGEASEHSARMIAMKNATDNASDLMDTLSLEYNKIRQQQITMEIADIVTARMTAN